MSHRYRGHLMCPAVVAGDPSGAVTISAGVNTRTDEVDEVCFSIRDGDDFTIHVQDLQKFMREQVDR